MKRKESDFLEFTITSVALSLFVVYAHFEFSIDNEHIFLVQKGDHCKIFSGCLFVRSFVGRGRTRGCMNNNVFVKFVVTGPYILHTYTIHVSELDLRDAVFFTKQPAIHSPSRQSSVVCREWVSVCVWFTVRVFLVIKSISMCGFVVVGTCSVDWMSKVSRSAKFNLAFVVVAADIVVVIL